MYYYEITITIGIVSFLISLAAQAFVSLSYTKYKRVNNKHGLDGFEVARKILDKNGLDDIKVVETSGNLTDHYDPTRKVIRLSSDIYRGTTIASASVAAHEVGHAIQDKEGYAFMKIRSNLVPVVNFCSKAGYVALVIGWLFAYSDLAYIGIFLLAATLLFQVITLPVEINASVRAENQLKELNLLESYEQNSSKKMLIAAAFTYIASLLTTILELLRLFLVTRNRDD